MGFQPAGNYVLLHRKILDWPLYGNITCRILFLHLLLRASWKGGRVFFRGTWIDLQPGDVATTVGDLSAGCGLTPKQVRTAVTVLSQEGTIRAQSRAKVCTVVSICNWSSYQRPTQTEGQSEGQREGKERAKRGQREGKQIEEGKEGKEGEEGTRTEEEAAAAVVSAAVEASSFTFPLAGGSLWTLPVADLQKFRATYKCDVDYELRKAALYLESHPGKRPKPGTGAKRFLTSWLARTDRGPPGARVVPVAQPVSGKPAAADDWSSLF